MKAESLLVLTAEDVTELLRGEEEAIVAVVRRAYHAHGRDESIVPHATCLRLPGGRDRIMALPAYLGGRFDIVGMKWIASVPDNLARGLERASGLVVLSATTTGRPIAIVEGSLVSAKRTAASAALAAGLLHDWAPAPHVGLVGCGVINFETLRFLLHAWPGIDRVTAYDSDPARSAQFAERCRLAYPHVTVAVALDWRRLCADVALLSIATTAMAPWLSEHPPRGLATILHLSLRDLTPELVLAADNVVDDADHVCRAETSLHLAECRVGDRAFIRADLPALLNGVGAPRRRYDGPTIFSPFGLGVLDIAVAQLVCERAETRGVGTWLRFSRPAAT